MTRRLFRFVLTIASIFGIIWSLSAASSATLAVQTEDEAYFDQTGQTVRGSFRSFWEARGGLAIFGYPISREFEQDGRETQYFERAVFQSFPENAGRGYGVQLVLLGTLLTADRQNEAAFQPVPQTASTAQMTYFPQTRHRLGGTFRRFWQANGGVDVFGYPLSEEFDERSATDGKTYRVQYFERARFEYHPEFAGTASEVLLGQLGVQYAQARKLSPDVLERQPGPLPEGLARVDNPVQAVVNGSFISPQVERFGEIAVGKGVFVASNTVLSADPGTRACIGSETNLQDNILFIVQRNRPAPAADCGPLSSSTDEEVSIAHQAVIKNSKIGKFTFVGFRSRLENVVLEEGAFVLHGVTLRNVTIPRDRLVPTGAVITTQAEADALPLKAEAQADFQRDVLEVNAEFAEGYAELYEHGGFDSVTGVSAAPRTTFNAGASPTLGAGVQLGEFARIVGDVRLGANSVVGDRTSIRADEGSPIVIGENAEIEDRVTFHALKGTSIVIGRNLDSDDNIVFHGPLTVADNLTIGDDAVLFRSTVGNNVTIGASAIVVDVTLRDGVSVPEGAVITTQAQADALR